MQEPHTSLAPLVAEKVPATHSVFIDVVPGAVAVQKCPIGHRYPSREPSGGTAEESQKLVPNILS